MPDNHFSAALPTAAIAAQQILLATSLVSKRSNRSDQFRTCCGTSPDKCTISKSRAANLTLRFGALRGLWPLYGLVFDDAHAESGGDCRMDLRTAVSHNVGVDSNGIAPRLDGSACCLTIRIWQIVTGR
jgi:hypothetical protein